MSESGDDRRERWVILTPKTLTREDRGSPNAKRKNKKQPEVTSICSKVLEIWRQKQKVLNSVGDINSKGK